MLIDSNLSRSNINNNLYLLQSGIQSFTLTSTTKSSELISILPHGDQLYLGLIFKTLSTLSMTTIVALMTQLKTNNQYSSITLDIFGINDNILTTELLNIFSGLNVNIRFSNLNRQNQSSAINSVYFNSTISSSQKRGLKRQFKLASKKITTKSPLAPHTISGDVGTNIRSGDNVIPGVTYDVNSHTFNLSRDIIFPYTSDDDVYIELLANETFNGHHHTISVGKHGIGSSYGLFGIVNTIDDLNTAPLIKKLTINSQVLNSGGGFIRESQSYFKVSDCHHVGLLDDNGGGICGESCESFIITKSSQQGDMGEFAGGLVGDDSGSGEIDDCWSSGAIGLAGGGIAGGETFDIKISHCKSTGHIGSQSGGICGAFSYGSSSGYLVTECESTGDIETQGGGICGYESYSDGATLEIRHCHSSGNIGNHSGGIVGQQCYINDGQDFIIDSCYSTGSIGEYSGGISGSNGIDLIITNCYSKGNISYYAGGISGRNSNRLHISYSYSSGLIGLFSGGITGANSTSNATLGFLISQCYSLGLIGLNSGGIAGYDCGGTTNSNQFQIMNCYALGDISAYAGGMIGSNCQHISISDVYTTGYVSFNAGGIVGNLSTDISESNCYTKSPVGGELDVNLIKKDSLGNLSNSIWQSTDHYPILRVFQSHPWRHHEYKHNTSQPKLTKHL